MTWVIAIAGFMFLIVSHEAGHFLAAKAVGMRVERFSLFFPPRVAGFRRGETEYQIGLLPLGGYVKITGMTPEELASVDLRVSDRAYYMKAPWKRIVVILAGPGVNLLLAIVLFTAVLLSGSLDASTAIGNLAPSQQTLRVVQQTTVSQIAPHSGAAGLLRPGDRITAIDGRRVAGSTVSSAITALHLRCAGAMTKGCAATTTVAVTVVRGGRTRTIDVLPHYDPGAQAHAAGRRPRPHRRPLTSASSARSAPPPPRSGTSAPRPSPTTSRRSRARRCERSSRASSGSPRTPSRRSRAAPASSSC